ncbi:MAG: alpha-L-fucosidase [Phycisphaeraceae bacterium]|nr:alpha-L-fucosidase [Phycisphaeraceae bacterium]
MTFTPTEQKYLDQVQATQTKRMKWWHDARFGMFVHWGLYSQLGRHEWVMNRERIAASEYEPLASTWKPKPRAARQWVKLARDAGMKYMVLTTKHHEGFLLWDSKQSDYNAVKTGPGRDLVREYVEACREFGLKVGFYHSLMDWHHPDGHRCAKDEAARVRFTQYTQACLRELMTNYGKIDILWYDVSWPLTSPQAWDSINMNAMVRKLQPHILINDRAQIPEDFSTPEEHITAAAPGRAWEACMTFNGAWGYVPTPSEDWHSARKVLDMLRVCTAGGGNLLINVGPKPDGTLPDEAVDRLTKVGKWMKTYGDVVYGKTDPVPALSSPAGNWTRKGDTYYFWCSRWPGKRLTFGGLFGKLVSATLLPGGKKLTVTQTPDRTIISGLPDQCPDKVTQVGMIALKFKGHIRQVLGNGCELPEGFPVVLFTELASPPVNTWSMTSPMPRNGSDIAEMPCASLNDASLKWSSVSATTEDGLVLIHDRYPDTDGMVYLANRFKVDKAGAWKLHLGHDGGAKAFVDGKAVLCTPTRSNPAMPGRSCAEVELDAGEHEVVVAFDLAQGLGWGMYFQWEWLTVNKARGNKPWFPKQVQA